MDRDWSRVLPMRRFGEIPVYLAAAVLAIAAGCTQETSPESQAADFVQAPAQDGVKAETEQTPAERYAEQTLVPPRSSPAEQTIEIASAGDEATKPIPAASSQQTKIAAVGKPVSKTSRVEPVEQKVSTTGKSKSDLLAGAKVAKVLLSQGHASLCRVKVGDAFPDVELPDFDGSPKQLTNLLGKNLTVVFLWRPDRAAARQELLDLEPDIVADYSNLGVNVVGILVGDDVELAKRLVENAGAGFPQLVDADGSTFAKIGSNKLPRTYLLDSSGRILWFDIEYSRSTRRELRAAIESVLRRDS